MPLVVNGLAFGLTWYATTSDGKDELQARAKALKANVFAEAEYESSRLFGFGEMKKWKGARAAAACVAEALPEGGLFIQRIDKDGTTCLIAVDGERRLPVPGMDQYGPRLKMIAEAKAYIESMGDEIVRVYGDVQPHEIEGAQESSLDRVAKDAVITGVLKPVREKDARWILAPLLAIGLGCVVFSEEIEDLATPQPVATITPEQNYRNQVKTAVDQVLQANQFPSSVMAGFLPFLATVPSEADGWYIDELRCIGTDCEGTWRRRPGATSEGVLRAMNLQATDTTVSFPDVDTMKRKLTFTKGQAPKQLMLAPNATFAEVVGTWLQGLADRGLSKPNVGQLQPLVPPSGGKIAPSDIPQFGQYKFTVSFTGKDLQAVAALPDLMTIESIELRREGDKKMSLQFDGKYYAF